MQSLISNIPAVCSKGALAVSFRMVLRIELIAFIYPFLVFVFCIVNPMYILWEVSSRRLASPLFQLTSAHQTPA